MRNYVQQQTMNPENMADQKFSSLFSKRQLKKGDKMRHLRKAIMFSQNTGVTLRTGKADDDLHGNMGPGMARHWKES